MDESVKLELAIHFLVLINLRSIAYKLLKWYDFDEFIKLQMSKWEFIMCKECSVTPYAAPAGYAPSINETSIYDEQVAIVANACMQTCLVLAEKASYYVNSKDRLRGYVCINFPMRLWSTFENWRSDGERERQVAIKLTQALSFILGINCRAPIAASSNLSFGNTEILMNGGEIYPYCLLAKRVLAYFPQDKFPDLRLLAHRMLHERPCFVRVPDSKNPANIVTCRNVQDLVQGTTYAATTHWNS